MGRPVKSDKKNALITLRCDSARKARYEQKVEAAGLSLTDWILGVLDASDSKAIIIEVVGAEPEPQLTPPAKLQMIRHVSAISNNLNQIARRLHTDNLAGKLNDATYLNLLESMRGIETVAVRVL